MVRIKSRQEIGLIRESSRIVADVLKLVASHIRPGVTTLELDRLAEDYIRSLGAIPAFFAGDSSSTFSTIGVCCAVENFIPSHG